MLLNIDMYLYDSLYDCANDTVNNIEDDADFCEAEYDLFWDWYDEKGFSEEDRKYVASCGYDVDQFIKEVTK